MVPVSSFLNDILRHLENAKDPLTWAGIIVVLLAWMVLYLQSKRHYPIKRPVEVILYGILLLAIISLMTGLYLKARRTHQVLHGRLTIDCQPAPGIQVSTVNINPVSTDGNGRFILDIPSTQFDSITITFIGEKNHEIGQQQIDLKLMTENEQPFKFGNCNPDTTIIISGKIFDGRTGKKSAGAKVMLKGYRSETYTDIDGNFSLKAEVRKQDLKLITIMVSADGYQDPDWPLSGENIESVKIPIYKNDNK